VEGVRGDDPEGVVMSNRDLLSDLLRQYTSGSAGSVATGHDPAIIERDFDDVTRQTSTDELSEGLAAAFRSDRTPPFPEMLGSLFGRSSGVQRAGILQNLMATLGPAVLAQILSRRGLGGMFGGGQPGPITPEVAAQVPPEAIQEAAEEAERKDPSIIDRLSRAYAEQPQIFKTLGAAALAIALGRLAQRKGTL
jgi:hypothetical protein